MRKYLYFPHFQVHGFWVPLVAYLFFLFAGFSCAFAADVPSRQSLRSPINPGGPEDWPETGGLSTSSAPAGQAHQDAAHLRPPFAPPSETPMPSVEPGPDVTLGHERPLDSEAPAAPQPVQAPVEPPAGEVHVPQAGRQAGGTAATTQVGAPMGAGPAEAQQPAEREVIYVDEEGNPVPKPPEPDKMFAEAQGLIEQGKNDEALALLDNIRAIPSLAPELLQNVLYAISDCVWNRYQDNPLAGYEPIISATNEALNANLRSPRVPDALLRLGLANINVGNLGEGQGYIVALSRRFPDYPGVAQGFTALGQGQLKQGKDADAERSFGLVLDKYPESSQLQAATVGLARALINQKKDERAQVILDFLSKRWPRYYISDPDFLLVQANNDEKMKRNDAAMDLRWLYVNLDPSRPENAPLLLKMADEYMANGKADAANFIYEDIGRNFPDSAVAPTARRRLAERGIYDSPFKYEQMEPVFAAAGQDSLWKIYSELADASSSDQEGIMARLKQAMWLYWDKQYPEAMGKAGDFIDDYPENPETPEAPDLLWKAFQKELAQSLAEQNYGRILLLWNGFPLVRERYGKIDAPLRYALAEGWAERGDDQKSFELLAEFLKGPMDPQFGEAAFSKFFNHYLQQGAWDKILDLGKLVRNWKMRPELQNQLDYAEALSAQNLNLGASALNRWRELAKRSDIPLYQQAYATYFLAKDAENRRDIRNAYEGNRKVVELFQRLADERSDKADPERIKEAMASLMDICEVGNRIPEALQWVDRYSAYVGEDSSEYPGLRFREARLHRKLGDNARAQALLENIVAKFPDSPFAQAAGAELRSFDVSRDLQRYVSGAPRQAQQAATGSTSGNWSSTTPQ
ncbi:MAG: tetratricopeptide repeat protein [Desulfovibrio sp.]|nr:tetratricopeptide repeat protein [Desulfovibrio sp.]